MPAISAAVIHSYRAFRPSLKAFLVLSFLSASLISQSGCAYSVLVRGVQVEGQAVIPASSSIRVAPMPEWENAQRADALQRKIEYLLEENGYRVAQDDSADYYLLFRSDIESLLSRMSLGSLSGGRGGMVTSHQPGPFERSLRMHVVEGDSYETDGAELVVWAGASTIHEAPTDGPLFDDLLLVAGFRKFAVETGSTLTVKLSQRSVAVKRIKAVGE